MALTDQQRLQIDHKYSAMAKTARGDRVRAILNAHPSIAAAVGKLWQNHLVYRPADSVINDLLCWYLWTEDRFGPSAALDALNRYLESQGIQTTLCVWVFGIEPKAIYQFGDVALVPCREMPDSREARRILGPRSQPSEPRGICRLHRNGRDPTYRPNRIGRDGRWANRVAKSRDSS